MACPKNSRSREELDQAKRLIDELGGISATAKRCGLSAVSVWQWKKNGVPKAWKLYLRSAYPIQLGFLTV